jgi:uncharacterized surface protein with fasciclin (FAS1) repeats
MDEQNNNEEGGSSKWLIGGIVALLLLAGGYFIYQQTKTPAEKAQDAVEDVAREVGDRVDERMEEKEEIMEEMSDTIVDIAAGNEDFSTLVTAVTAAELVETLAGEGPFTVFAPTNAAFDKLPEGTLESVLADPEQLTSILTYHVVPGKVMAEDIVNVTSVTTVQGQDATVKVVEGEVMINDAKVVAPDIEASNGVIHVIDTVLLPQ